MTAIPFIRRTSSERVDGTLTVKIDIEPQYRVKFMQMFPEIGSAGAIAALTQESTIAAAQEETQEKVKPGALCVMACTFCADPQFRKWLFSDEPATERDARENILSICGILSRKELDTQPTAAERFHKQIRLPFLAWKEIQ